MKRSAPNEVGPAVPVSDGGGTSGDRAGRLAEVRAMIESGVYETTERWEIAVSRLLAKVGENS